MALSSRGAPGSPDFMARPFAQRFALFQNYMARRKLSNEVGPPNVGVFLSLPERQALQAMGAGAAPAGDVPTDEAAPAEEFDWTSLFSGGGGGGTTISPAMIAPQPQLPKSGAEADQYVREHYGMYAFLLDDPTVGPLLERAALEGWPDDRVMAEVQGTDWWKNSTESQRAWDALANTDPGTAKRTLDTAVQSVRQLFARYGLTVEGNPRALEMAFGIVREGWNEQQLQRAVVSEISWDATSGVPNPLGNSTVEVTKLASDFAVPLSMQAAFDTAKQFEMGDLDEATIQQRFRDQAALTYTWWAPDLQGGATVRQLADPYVQTYAQLLEVAPGDVDLTDAKFQDVLAVNETGGRRQRSLTEARQLVMSDARYAWDATTNAKGAALSLVDSLSKTFGVR